MALYARGWQGMGKWLLVGALLGAGGAQAATSVLIWPIDPVLEADQKAGALWLENRGTTPANLQVRVFAWRQDGYDDQFQPQREIIGSRAASCACTFHIRQMPSGQRVPSARQKSKSFSGVTKASIRSATSARTSRICCFVASSGRGQR